MWMLLMLAICTFLHSVEPSTNAVSHTGRGLRQEGGCGGFVCREDEEFLECGCQRTCCNKGRIDNCAERCTKGCFCKDGLVRNDSGNCVRLKDCKKTNPVTPPPLECRANEQYYECIPSCQGTCEAYNRKEKIYCNQLCRAGCFCKEGLYLRKDGQCVRPSQCVDTTPPPIKLCGANEEYSNCGTACPLTCANRNHPPPCIALCKEGCFCKLGFVRDENGRCVLPNECPQVCGYNEEMVDCAKPINCNSCSNKICYFKRCVKGCDCKEGYYRNGTGICIPESQCPEECRGYNEGLVECAKPKWCNTCGIRGNCKLSECMKGCDCLEGHYRNDSGVCIPKEQCSGSCPQNEVSSDCVIPCNDCEIRGKCNFLVCNKGCDCKKGYYRDINRKCIPEAQCPVKPPPPIHTCGVDEEYYGCMPTCNNTCENYSQQPHPCPLYCRSGCDCRKGLVRRSDGRCVLPSQCNPSTPTKPPTHSCGVDEEYYGCKPTCNNTCENYSQQPQLCPLYCQYGCDCRRGLVRRKDGKCVPPSECNPSIPTRPPTHTCGVDEEYYGCMPTCNNTCENYSQQPHVCPLYCRSGCDCRKGLTRRSDGKCVLPAECNPSVPTSAPPTCGVNEQYYGCKPTCRNTCENYFVKNPICSRICIQGCHCKPGYVMRKDGKCVLPSQCDSTPPVTPPPHCRADEQYYKCMPNCQRTCEALKVAILCPAICRSGCFCKEGLYEREDGKCVPADQCVHTTPPIQTCGVNEEYTSCGSACPATCGNRGKPVICTQQCVPGCFCREGMVRNEFGQCVELSQCPTVTPPLSHQCKADEQYYQCTPICHGTCEAYNSKVPVICNKMCKMGCFCREGLYLRKDGKCVPPSQCDSTSPITPPPPHQCKADEQYYQCTPICHGTCEAYNSKGPVICNKMCTMGCFCREGLYLRRDGKCVPPSQCNTSSPTQTCGVNEEYTSCGSACPATCANRGKPVICTQQCVPGCFCREGMVRNEFGQCVELSQCPTETCEENEEYSNCGSHCPLTCANRNNPPICIQSCKEGCFCKKGLIRNEEGRCVSPRKCPPETCGEDEEYSNCGSHCPLTCANRNNPPICIQSCKEGCFCKKGLIRNEEGRCVSPRKCPPVQKPPICEQKMLVGPCKAAITRYYFNKQTRECEKFSYGGCQGNDNNFKSLEECQKTCGGSAPTHCRADEQYYECIPSCQRTCDALNQKVKIYCAAICRPGCFCRDGLYQRKDGKCVPANQCNNTPPTLPPAHNPICDEKKEVGPCLALFPRYYFNKKTGQCEHFTYGGCHGNDNNFKTLAECQKTCGGHSFPICGKDEQHYGCVPNCRNTCETYNKTDIMCPMYCVTGCFCKEGTVKRKDGKCVPPSQCTPVTVPPTTCGRDEEYYDECAPSCTGTCNTYNKTIYCPLCRPGCWCRKGLVKNDEGKCVPPSKCPNVPPMQCSKDEQYYDECAPSCGGTCDTYNKKIACPLCRPGCWCKEGLVKNKNGKCVPTSQCPTGPPTQCGKDEEYYEECAPSCGATCETYNKTIRCPRCRPGCWCKKGLVKRKDGKCVPPSKCQNVPPTTCGRDEEYYDECAPSCTGTCNTYNKTIYCPLCHPGCWCRKGLVKNEQGKCVPPSKCPNVPPIKCSKGEQYYDECAPSCGGTCDTYNKKIACPLCRPGCWCKEGLVKNKDGKCVPTSQCPTVTPVVCKRDEEYYEDCAPSCGGTCDTYDKLPLILCPVCQPGCWCKKGFVKTKEGKCVPPTKCPNTTPPPQKCGHREEYYECIPNCRGTCQTYNATDILCPDICVRGCFCKKGLVKDDHGTCVKPSECTSPSVSPPPQCRKDEQYYECIPSCQRSCNALNQKVKIYCKQLCRPGCFCKDGLYQRKDGKCVPPRQCSHHPQGNGSSEEEYYTSEEYSEEYSSETSVSESWHHHQHSSTEIDWSTEDTSQEGWSILCRKDEVYYPKCAPSCGGTCETYNKKIHCPICRPGCWCRKGLVKTKDGKCVAPSTCPGHTVPPVACPDDQQYYSCIPTCRRSCMSYNSTNAICTKECIRGCFCKDGYVVNKEGKCVRPKDCPQSCGFQQQYYECMPECRNRCNPPDVCAAICRGGCFCREDLVLRDDGMCVPKGLCDDRPSTQQCGPNKQYYECYQSCKNTCTAKRHGDVICPEICERGCFCKPGLLIDSEGNCVKPKDCRDVPQGGGAINYESEYYSEEIDSSSELSYSHTTVKGGHHTHHHDEDFSDSDSCESEESVSYDSSEIYLGGTSHGGSVACKKGEQYYKCIPNCHNTCETYHKTNIKCPMYCRPGCFCKEGTVKRKDGKCVPPSQCSSTGSCPQNEVSSDCVIPCNDCEIRGKCNFLVCNKGCDCKKGYYRDIHRKCIPEAKCPDKRNCPMNEVYSDCVNPCNDCEIKGKCNFLVCNKGCDCKKGYYRDIVNNKCIPESLCPVKQASGKITPKEPHHPKGTTEQSWSWTTEEGSHGDFSRKMDRHSETEKLSRNIKNGEKVDEIYSDHKDFSENISDKNLSEKTKEYSEIKDFSKNKHTQVGSKDISKHTKHNAEFQKLSKNDQNYAQIQQISKNSQNYDQFSDSKNNYANIQKFSISEQNNANFQEYSENYKNVGDFSEHTENYATTENFANGREFSGNNVEFQDFSKSTQNYAEFRDVSETTGNKGEFQDLARNTQNYAHTDKSSKTTQNFADFQDFSKSTQNYGEFQNVADKKNFAEYQENAQNYANAQNFVENNGKFAEFQDYSKNTQNNAVFKNLGTTQTYAGSQNVAENNQNFAEFQDMSKSTQNNAEFKDFSTTSQNYADTQNFVDSNRNYAEFQDFSKNKAEFQDFSQNTQNYAETQNLVDNNQNNIEFQKNQNYAATQSHTENNQNLANVQEFSNTYSESSGGTTDLVSASGNEQSFLSESS